MSGLDEGITLDILMKIWNPDEEKRFHPEIDIFKSDFVKVKRKRSGGLVSSKNSQASRIFTPDEIDQSIYEVFANCSEEEDVGTVNSFQPPVSIEVKKLKKQKTIPKGNDDGISVSETVKPDIRSSLTGDNAYSLSHETESV